MTARPIPLLCEERLAIALEAGVSRERARVLATEDARRCREGRACICEEGRRDRAVEP